MKMNQGSFFPTFTGFSAQKHDNVKRSRAGREKKREFVCAHGEAGEARQEAAPTLTHSGHAVRRARGT